MIEIYKYNPCSTWFKDVVIANNKLDDICFEDFLAEIREGLAQIVDEN